MGDRAERQLVQPRELANANEEQRQDNTALQEHRGVLEAIRTETTERLGTHPRRWTRARLLPVSGRHAPSLDWLVIPRDGAGINTR